MHIKGRDLRANRVTASCGVFDLAPAKISIWRDYFDLATYTRVFVATK
ncbi:limonene-1,2-epoxide hydrolase family protein [Bradyrhizobium sp.]